MHTQLGENMIAKVADFGMARLQAGNEESETMTTVGP